MKIHVDPAQYGNQDSKITITIQPWPSAKEFDKLVAKLELIFPEATFSFDKAALGGLIEDCHNTRNAA